MLRYLFYCIALYATMPFSPTVDVATVIVFFVLIEEDERFALCFAFLAGLISDLYFPVRLGANMLTGVTLGQLFILLKKYLVLNPLTTIASFIVFYFLKTAALNVAVSLPIEPMRAAYTILVAFPTLILLRKTLLGVGRRE